MTAPLRARRPEIASPNRRPVRLRAVETTTTRRLARARSWSVRRRISLVGSGLLFAAVLAGNVAVHAGTTQGQFDLERLRDTARQRQATYQQLRLRVAELQSPDRIVEEARRLGMVEPGKVTYLTPTTTTSSDDRSAPASGPVQSEAAQSWGQVKPHLGARP